MAELSFERSFLATLSSRPSRLSANHVEDPHLFPARGAYILPKMSRPMTKHQNLVPGQERSLSISLKSMRNPPLDIVLKSQSPLTSILALKMEVSSQSLIPLDKIKILYKKKPVGDAKVLKELVGDDETGAEFTVMVMGGISGMKRDGIVAATGPVAPGASGMEVLGTERFWLDLKEFLNQRLKDPEDTERVYGLFKTSWENIGVS